MPLIRRPLLIRDPWGNTLASPDGFLLGYPKVAVSRYLPAEMSGRFTPKKPPAELAWFALDFMRVVGRGVGLAAVAVHAWTNTVMPVLADSDWTIGAPLIEGRIAYTQLGGGVDGSDYQLRFTVTDTDGNVFERTGLILVSETS
jgi:hypothetical protein